VTRYTGVRCREGLAQGLGDALREGCCGGGIEFARAPFDAEACPVVVAWDDVDVEMHDGLVGEGAVVLEEVVRRRAGGLEHGPADAGEGAAQGGGGVVAELVHGDGGLFGDDEGVAAGEGEDVEEGKDAVVLVDFVAGDFAADDLGEDGVGHGRVYGRGERGEGTLVAAHPRTIRAVGMLFVR